MEVITIQSEAYKSILQELNNIKEVVCSKQRLQPLNETWLDIQEVCLLLKISKRTLQSYRDNNILPYSQVAGKIYFKAGDIEEHLLKHYVKLGK
jgi:hypothetical protein